MSRIEAPQDDCPKCGEERAFSMSEPQYERDYYAASVHGPYGGEYLEWPCLRCGFRKRTPVASKAVPV